MRLGYWLDTINTKTIMFDSSEICHFSYQIRQLIEVSLENELKVWGMN